MSISKRSPKLKNLLKLWNSIAKAKNLGFWNLSLYQPSKQIGLPKILYLKINSDMIFYTFQSTPLDSPWSESPSPSQPTSPATPHFGQVPTSVVGDQSHSVSEKLPPRILSKGWGIFRWKPIGCFKISKLQSKQYQRLSLQKTKTNDTKKIKKGCCIHEVLNSRRFFRMIRPCLN